MNSFMSDAYNDNKSNFNFASECSYNVQLKNRKKMLNMSSQEIDIKECYLRYGPMVLRRCRYLLQNEEKALDAMQEVFAKLLVNRKKFKDQFLSSLLYKIATNLCLNIIRDERKHEAVYGDEFLMEIAAFDPSEHRTNIRDLLDRIFKTEKKLTREIAVYHWVDGMTLQEVADETGMSLSGVRKRISELRRRIEIKKEIYHEH